MGANGKLMPSELMIVQRGRLPIALANMCAEQWLSMKDAYDRSHTDELSIAVPVGGYRSYATQVDMHWRPGLYGLSTSSVIRLAQPGYSTHGDGMAVDVADASTDSPRKRWLLGNAERFGFIRQFGEADPNHYRLTSVTAGSGTKIIEQESEHIMDETRYYWGDEGGAQYFIVGATYPGGSETSTDVATGQAWGKMFGKEDGSPFGKLPLAQINKLKAEAAVLNQRWVAQQRSIFAGVGGADLGPVLNAVAGVAGQVTNLDTKVSGFPASPTANDVATETIRQMKLPGN